MDRLDNSPKARLTSAPDRRYRLMVRRQGARVRSFTHRGFDWSHRFPLIVEAAGTVVVSASANLDLKSNIQVK